MSSELVKRVKAVRRLIKPRDREFVHGCITYSCTCGMSQCIGVANGVDLPGERKLGVPAPSRLHCEFCDSEAAYVPDSYKMIFGGRSTGMAYFRIPSRRGLHKVDGFEAQLVVPPTGIDIDYKAPDE